MYQPDGKGDLLAIPAFLKREPMPSQPITAQPATPVPAITPPDWIWIMPKSTKSKPAKSQKTDPAVVAAKKQRAAEPKAKVTSKPAANIQEYIARGKHRGLALAPADGTTEHSKPCKQRDDTKQAKLTEMLRR